MTNRTFLALTVYNGTGLVRERRKLTFAEGGNVINFTDVASSIKPETVKFMSLTDSNGTRVIEQSYVHDLVNSNALLRRFIDHVITLTTKDGHVYEGKLLSVPNIDKSIILESEDGQLYVLAYENLRDMQFPSLPDGLITRPTLRWLIYAHQAGEHEIELTYLTSNIRWSASYNILLAKDNNTINLNGWLTVSNNSGVTYTNAHLKCVAGELNTVQSARLYKSAGVVSTERAIDDVQQRDFFEYKLYDVPNTTTLANNEIKQIEFIIKQNIPTTLSFITTKQANRLFNAPEPILEKNIHLHIGNDIHTEAHLTFSLTEDTNADLPAGEMRIYQEDVDGSILLIGESEIKHTPKGEKIDIALGRVFDVVGEYVQTKFSRISEKVLQESFEIKLRNRKESETVEVRVPERLFRWSNWEILNANMDYTQKDASTIEFLAIIPPRGEVVITYTVQYSW